MNRKLWPFSSTLWIRPAPHNLLQTNNVQAAILTVRNVGIVVQLQLYQRRLHIIRSFLVSHSIKNGEWECWEVFVQVVVLYIDVQLHRLWYCTAMYNCTYRLWYCTLMCNCTYRLWYCILMYNCTYRLWYCTLMCNCTYRLWYCTLMYNCTNCGTVHLCTNVQIVLLYIGVELYSVRSAAYTL